MRQACGQIYQLDPRYTKPRFIIPLLSDLLKNPGPVQIYNSTGNIFHVTKSLHIPMFLPLFIWPVQNMTTDTTRRLQTRSNGLQGNVPRPKMTNRSAFNRVVKLYDHDGKSDQEGVIHHRQRNVWSFSVPSQHMLVVCNSRSVGGWEPYFLGENFKLREWRSCIHGDAMLFWT